MLPLVSPPFHVEKKLQTSEKRPTPVKNAPAAPQQVCKSGDPGPWTLWVHAGTQLCLGPTPSTDGLQGWESLCNCPAGAHVPGL